MYYFYMGSVLLPVAPKKFSLKIKNQNHTMTLIDGTEINFLKDAGLTDLEFEVMLPAVPYSFAVYNGSFKMPTYYMNHFEQLKTGKTPFQLIVVRLMPNGRLINFTNMTVSLESYTIAENASEGFDTTVTLKLKQYKPFGTKIVSVINDTPSIVTPRETVNSPAPSTNKTYVVKSGDTLWGIAKNFYGDGSKYTKIYEANKDKITNPNLIYPDQVLTIPSL